MFAPALRFGRSSRQCNKDAIFQNVLTMTGQSPDLNNPSFLCKDRDNAV